MSSLADIPALAAAAEALDSWDWMERILAAHERQPTVYQHFVYHEGGLRRAGRGALHLRPDGRLL